MEIYNRDLKKKFAVVRLWETINTAETECISRLKKAALNLGMTCIEISPSGICCETGKVIDYRDVDFAIHLHFETPKNYDVFSFVALWNPLQYYFDWGYERISKHLISHDDFLSCSSRGADDQIKRLIYNQPLHLFPQFEMYHSLSSPFFSPESKQRQLMYIGINWEKLVKGKSRHQEVLRRLDSLNQIKIYGPRIFQGYNIWQGYKNYVRELPFDGESVVKELNALGAGLVLSSEAHKDSELMSNRLFETIAAGAISICDENKFAKEHFGDSLLYVDSSSPTLCEDIIERLFWMNKNPDSIKEKILAAQKIFKNKFCLEKSLGIIYERLLDRKKALSVSSCAQLLPKVFLLCILVEETLVDFERMVNSCEAQQYQDLSFLFFIDQSSSLLPQLVSRLEKLKISYEIIQISELYRLCINKMGKLIYEVLSYLSGKEFDYFCISLSNEELFHNHINSLADICLRGNAPSVVSTACILQYKEDKKSVYEYQDSICWGDEIYHRPLGFGRFFFSKNSLSPSIEFLLPYLGKKAICVLLGNQEVISSSLVTLRIDCSSSIYKSRMLERMENALIRDVFKDKIPPNPPQFPSSKLMKRMAVWAEKNKSFIKELSMPLFLRKIMRAAYVYIKSRG